MRTIAAVPLRLQGAAVEDDGRAGRVEVVEVEERTRADRDGRGTERAGKSSRELIARSGGVAALLRFMRSCNRSKPHVEVLHRALAVAQPGDVMVVFANGAYEHGYWGEIMGTMAQARGLAGLVIDACVRDGALIAQMGFPVFSRGLCIRGTGKDFGATGWINHPVMIGDITVHAGDLVVGDGDGVVVIPQAQAAEVVAAGVRREQEEAEEDAQRETHAASGFR